VTDPAEKTVLVLQGGGALGAYQAGAYEGLAIAGYMPSWVAINVAGEGIDWDHVADRIAQSWELAAPRRLLEAGGR
jgi:hypothetical protein